MASNEGPIDEAAIPVIDISPRNAEAAGQLLAAARDHGFLFIANNDAGVAPDLIARMFQLSRDFFALPEQVKQKVSINSNKAGKNHGWLSQGVEKLDPAKQKRPDVKEAFNMGAPVNGRFEQLLPTLFEQNLTDIIAFQQSCHELCQRLLRHLAVALEVDPTWFTDRHDQTRGPVGTVFRLLYYPGSDLSANTGEDLRAGAHSDYGSITCLFQLPGQPGLEIQTPSGAWAPVPVDPRGSSLTSEESQSQLPILINIGDLLEDWTGGLLKSTVHRVVFPGGRTAVDRYSIAYFNHPLDEARLEPVPSRAVAEYAKRSGPRKVQTDRIITAKDHLTARLAATYTVSGGK